MAHCAIVGAGVIGAGWAARLALNGFDVTIHDPHPEAEHRTRKVLANAARARERLSLVPPAAPGALRFAATLAETVAGAHFIQESSPEREDLKRTLLREIDAHASPEALICSSTSGLLPSRLQAEMTRPERFLVGHPFNPVYLLPLVELCGGARTAPEAIARARDFYAAIGMRPLLVRKEIDGFIADRLLEALWREALWLVHDDVASVAEVDDAIRFGAGLRWSFMGTFLTYRLAGGEEGMRHFMAQFGPALKLPWTKLMEVPELSEAFIDKISDQSDAQANGANLRALERKRDDCLVAVMQALKSQDFGAGQVLATQEAGWLARAHAAAASPADPSLPLRLHQGTVPPGWVDYNGHMTESRYLQAFGDATDALLRHLGVDAAYLSGGHSYFTVETHLMHRRQLREGDAFAASTQILGADEKRIHLFHRLHDARTDEVAASAEQMLLHVDTRADRATPAGPAMAARVAALRAAQAALPRPAEAGRSIVIRQPAQAPA